MQYLAILTLVLGNEQATTVVIVDGKLGMTREDIWKHLRQDIAGKNRDDRWLGATTVFFSVELNNLAA